MKEDKNLKEDLEEENSETNKKSDVAGYIMLLFVILLIGALVVTFLYVGGVIGEKKSLPGIGAVVTGPGINDGLDDELNDDDDVIEDSFFREVDAADFIVSYEKKDNGRLIIWFEGRADIFNFSGTISLVDSEKNVIRTKDFDFDELGFKDSTGILFELSDDELARFNGYRITNLKGKIEQ